MGKSINNYYILKFYLIKLYLMLKLIIIVFIDINNY